MTGEQDGVSRAGAGDGILGPSAVLAVAALIVVVLLGTVVVVAGLLTRRPPDSAPGLAQPVTAPAPVDAAARARWAETVSARTGIPARAVAAYGDAEVGARDAWADCGITWTTLAGLGRVESNHGRFGGASLGEDGRPEPPVLGVALDGTSGNREVRDTDGGRLDGDPSYDRAVGPLQFIPTTWAVVGVDADGDGRSDPQDIDDAAASAASYLCAGTSGEAERDVRRGDDWRSATLSYNRSTSYVERVHAEAVGYATAGPPAGPGAGPQR